jgi:hypothetical protein
MKKQVLVLSALFIGATLGLTAQTQRINLFEEWTGENCNPCAATNPGITVLANANYAGPKKMILLRYQVPIPSAPSLPTSLYQQNPSEPNARQDYYYPTPTDQFAPQGRMNGHELGRGDVNGNNGNAGWLAQDSIDLEYQMDAPFAMTTAYAWNATEDSITITTTITAAQNFSTANPLTLQLAIIEEHIHYATPPGSNGEKDFEFIMRKMVPDENGQTLPTTWTNGQMQTITNTVKLPTYIWNKSEVAIVAFIQEDVPSPGPLVTRNVHQAAYGDIQALHIDAQAAAVNGFGHYICTNTFDPVFMLRNNGINNLTSCDINYQIDGGTINTINWTGSLTTGQTDPVNIPTQTVAAGGHVFNVTVTNVNGVTDANMANNNISVSVQNVNVTPVYPLFEGFETNAFPYTNWELINPDNSDTWGRTTTAHKTGAASLLMDNADYAANGQIDEFRLPPIDISAATAPAITFQVAYKLWTNPALTPHWSDTLEVFVSTDCGASFISVYKKHTLSLVTVTGTPYQASNFVPTAAQWRLETIDLTSYVGTPNLLVKFRNTNDYENQLFIDDINIMENAVGLMHNNSVTEAGLYPNPSNGHATLTFHSDRSDKASLNIYNALGQSVSTQSVEITSGANTVELNTANFPNGIYFINLTGANGKMTQQLIINH